MDLFYDTIQWYYICSFLLPLTILVWSILSKFGLLIFALTFVSNSLFISSGVLGIIKTINFPVIKRWVGIIATVSYIFFVDFYLLDSRLVVANRNVQVDCFDIHFYHNSWRGKILQLKGMKGKLRFKDLTYMVCHPLMKFICIISLLFKHDLFFKLITWYCEISEYILVGN